MPCARQRWLILDSVSQAAALHIDVDVSTQRMRVRAAGGVREYAVSTAANGPGELMDSECTPRGRHVITEKIGAGLPVNAVLVGRRWTGEIYTPEMRAAEPGRDWILTRILWLAGCEPGRNQGGNVDSRARYIYIHGTPDDTDMAVPGSRGCIRMRNSDLLELFERVDVDTPVDIHGG
ncbi:MAG: L,D-transpeptidase [Gammaproteobacteria bacterium]|nr:L,D-transpeptidase [Gammaproteobacteria bacterium]